MVVWVDLVKSRSLKPNWCWSCFIVFALASFFAPFLAAGFVSVVDSVVDAVVACVFVRLEPSSERSGEEGSSRAAFNLPPSVFALPLTSA